MIRQFKVFREDSARAAQIPQASTHAVAPDAAPLPPTFQRDAGGEIARLVQRLFLSPQAAEAHRLVVFCGVDRGAGCSWVCARAAESLASQISGRACIVDANLRSPILHESFQCRATPGFADALRQDEPIECFLSPTRASHLWLMTAGSMASAINGAFNPARIRARFAELREQFDVLLVDTPAIGPFNDAITIGQMSDGVVLVIASNATRREAARAAKETLEEAGVAILGATLNKRTYPIPDALYRRL